jgi:hypothetical protein
VVLLEEYCLLERSPSKRAESRRVVEPQWRAEPLRRQGPTYLLPVDSQQVGLQAASAESRPPMEADK